MSGEEILSLAVDFYNRYPVETVSISARVAFAAPTVENYVQIRLPSTLIVENFALANHMDGEQMYASEEGHHTLLTWKWPPKTRSLMNELVIDARVAPDAPQGPLDCEAVLLDAEGVVLFQTTQQIMIRRRADTLRYLPEIYSRDDFTNRFLMLLESFWTPISRQIDEVDNYFDPALTPEVMVPWLGSWFGLTLDDDLSEERKRKLVASIAPIYAQKGTRQALITFLTMYTGGTVDVVEHRDTNFVLGESASLGYQVALGTQNRPHSFDVFIKAPAPALRPGEGTRERRKQYYKRIESLIDQYKPAHTVFNLDIEYV